LKREIKCIGDTAINGIKAELPKAEVVCGCVWVNILLMMRLEYVKEYDLCKNELEFLRSKIIKKIDKSSNVYLCFSVM
jgi:hypothetical protein